MSPNKKTLILSACVTIAALPVLAFLALTIFLSQNQWGLTVKAVFSQNFPKADPIAASEQIAYQITSNNLQESSSNAQSGAYATAYVLRHFGIEVTGQAVYEDMNHLPDSGYVMPKTVSDYLRENGLQTTLYKGKLAQLETWTTSGNPVIVILGQGHEWQRYVIVTGFDEMGLYLYDPTAPPTNQFHNSYLTKEEFEALWANGLPFFERIYLPSAPIPEK